jgi:hypothetical protein
VSTIARRAGDLLLAILAVLVVVAAVAVVTRDSRRPASTLSVAPAASSGTPAPKPSASRTRTAVSSVVLAGPDLAALRDALATSTGYQVQVVPAGSPEVLAAGALDKARGTPDVVVLEVLPGSKTTPRTTTAITDVQSRWPGARVVVVGPLSSLDHKSSVAARAAATTMKVTFLDPVALGWKTDETSRALAGADVERAASKLAASLR